MRYRVIALFSAVLFAFAAFGGQARTEEAKNDVKGLFLLTDYPAVTLRPGTTSSVSLKLQNYGLPPERLALSVAGVPQGWTVTLVGGGQPVAAALPATNASVPLELRLDVPKDAPVGTTNLTVNAQGGTPNASLPIAVTLATNLPAKLTLNPQLPELRGNSKSNFEFTLGVKNDSGKKVTVALSATGAAEFRRHVHRAVRQPGAQRAAARPRPVEGRQAQGQAAEHDRRRQVQRRRQGLGRGRLGDQRSGRSTSPASPGSTSAAARACSARARRRASRPRSRSS